MHRLEMAPYQEQQERWPREGKHILAQYDKDSIVVYQAYRPSIAEFAIANGRFGGEYSYSRMSWIKPSFLWMMHRCGWCTKRGQERVLAIRLRIAFFDWLLSQAVPSTHDQTLIPRREDWPKAVQDSSVRLQWDPDRDPRGLKLKRRAIQLGLRGDALRRYGQEELLEVLDVTQLAMEQWIRKEAGDVLLTPLEAVYIPCDEAVRCRIRLDE